ncbi:MAG: glycosyltransferase family 39 protein [Helicobacteraceae bacterium]|jgi:hypothetical protein|nr:glycosyltransferase family 39 protein [Helicobacteraceae bacterium]
MDARFLARFLASKKALALFLALDGTLLFLYAPSLGVSASEAKLFFNDSGALGGILRFSVSLFGQNNFAIRAPFILMHLFNTAMIYIVARRSARPIDAFFSALLFALLPGVNSAAILVSLAPFAIGVALIYLWLNDRCEPLAIALLFLAALADNLFIALILAAICYYLYQKRFLIAVLPLIFILISYALYGFEFGGKPKGYFLDIFGLYGAIFSPLVFGYFIYALYWRIFKRSEKLPLLWFVCAAPFALSIVLSLRQNLPIEDYAPFAALCAPLLVDAFMNSWRIRLPQFRKAHIMVASIIIVSLLFILALSFIHKPLYALMGDSGKHFARNYHFADELAQILKKRGINAVECSSKNLAIRLRFYGIESDDDYVISLVKPPEEKEADAIEFFVLGVRAAVFYLSVKQYANEAEKSADIDKGDDAVL